MTELILFHHAQGLTEGVQAFADDLRAAGHVVHVPDLYDGQTFGTLADGMGYAETLGFGTIIERGRRAAEGLPDAIVYAGFSLRKIVIESLRHVSCSASAVRTSSRKRAAAGCEASATA